MNNSLYYEYLNDLSQNVIPTSNIKTVYICGFYINLDGFVPFVQYLLCVADDGFLEFPSFELGVIKDTSHLVEVANTQLLETLSSDDIHIDIQSVRCCGFKVVRDCVYIFYDFMNTKIVSNHSRKTRFCLIDEIVNTLTVCEHCVSSKTTGFLLENPDMLFLNDGKNNKYEIPSAVYVHCDANKMHMIYTFGQTIADETAILGPYYYFTTFHNAPPKRTNCGVVRVALFGGVTLIKQNLPSDAVDESAIKYELVQTLDCKYERMTCRVSDHSGTWSNNYDSVYLGQVELDDGSILRDAPFIVAKDRARHIPLSYHQIAKSNRFLSG
jgi:hypothetical protein